MTGRPPSTPLGTPPDAAGRHVLVSYDTDAAFVATAARRLAPALEEGEAAVVITDGNRRRDLMAALAGHGLDMEGAARAEQLLSLDAAALRSACTTDGDLDVDRLVRVMVQAATRAASRDQRVHVVSELAPLLWQQGEQLAAVSVEAAGTNLVKSWPLSLLCPYPNAFATFDHRPGFAAICDQHTNLLHPRDGT